MSSTGRARRSHAALAPNAAPAAHSPLAAHALLAALACACALSCGLVGKDVSIEQSFQAGGSAPGSGAQLPASTLTTPLAASAGDLSKLSSVTLSSATLESTDGLDLSFISGGTLTLSATGISPATLATLAAPGAVGITRFAIGQSVDLKPYLAAGGELDAVFTYSTRPVVARGLKLTLVVHASL
jgi:hypothetical protein